MSRSVSVHARKSRRALLGGLACAAALTAGSVATVGPAVQAGAPPAASTVQLLAFNDYHGHVESDTANFGRDKGGGEHLSAKLTELRAASTADQSLTVAAGDLIGGSPYFSGLFHDEPSVESLNAMGLDVSSVGNHEFDEGVDELIRMQTGGCHPVDGCYFPGEPYAGADFQWLAGNVKEDTPGAFAATIPGVSFQDAGNGQQIAFIGMTLEGTSELVAAAGIEGFTFSDEVERGNELVELIRFYAPDVEAIVLLLHEGGITDPVELDTCEGITGPIIEIAENLDPEIDAIITGHTHLPYNCSIPDPDNNPRSITSAQSFGLVVTEIELPLDIDGEVIRDGVTAMNHEVVHADLTPDPAVTAVIDKWTPLADEIGLDPVGEITESIFRGGTETGDPLDEDRGIESSAGNLVADAQLAATEVFGAQIALMNPGGVRSDLAFEQSGVEGDGVVTFGEAFTFQPFNNTMFVLPMTGEQLVNVLKEQCQPTGSSRPILHLGVSDGLTYDFNTIVDAGNCTAVDVTNVQLDGVDIDPATTYQVATNNFLADGGDNFETFAEVDPNNRIPGPQDIDALIAYLEANSPVAPPSTDRVNEIPPAIIAVEPGRLLETRSGIGNTTVDGLFLGDGRLAADGEIELKVTERAGVPADAEAVLLNIGIVAPSEGGFATLYPCGIDLPKASSINFGPDTASNAVLVKVGDGGSVCIYTSAEAHVIADVLSAVPAGGSPAAVDPSRLLETRIGPDNTTVDGEFEGDGPIPADGEVVLTIAERGGVPANAGSVVLNLGAINPTEGGFFTVWSCEGDRPQASTVNFPAGAVTSNSVTAEINGSGNVCVYSSVETNAIADLNAYVPAGAAPTGIEPARLLETRVGPDNITVDGLFEGDGPVAAEGVVELQVAGRGGVPATASAVVLNVGAIRPTERGFITVHKCGEDLPTASNVNYVGGDIVSNAVIAEVGADGLVCIYTSAETDLIVDVTAAVTPPTPVAV